MALFQMTSSQLRFPQLSFKDAQGDPVALSALKLDFVSEDPSIVAWEKRNAAGAADPAGDDAAVAQGPLGKVVVHVTATNPDGTTVGPLDGELEIVPDDAASGDMSFGPAIEKS